MNAISSGTAFWALVVVTAVLILILAILHLARYRQKPKRLLRKIEWLRTFYVWLGALAILGGTWAFFLPIALNSGFNKDDDGPALRQLLIYATGGILGVITLGETHRRNNLEKDKNNQDHIRQVHAERRNRYTTATEQLSSNKASIRLGGIYILVGLVEEWLADEKTIPNIKERRKEGQVIINNLCAYIRSPFDLASKVKDLSKDKAPKNYEGGNQQFIKDQARLHEEKELRITILQEIKTRLNDDIITQKDRNKKILKGPWSGFNYDFSNAHFFYTVDFNHSYFGGLSKFFGAEFIKDANFLAATFTKTSFSGAKFSHKVAPGGYNFDFSPNSPKIETEKHEFNGRTFTIPKGAMLFNPDAPQEQDRIRQIHAERHNRYTTAVEQLSNDKASIRLGGVYTLVGLVDEWLADGKTIPNIEERRKEGQVIINNLCAYIRSPFLLAERAKQLDAAYAKDLRKDFDGDTEKFDADKQTFTRNKAALEEERQVRSTILQKIHERLQSGSKPGPWSDFEYNFSNAKFFYLVNFESSHFCTFLDFSGATFTEKADFSKVTFTGETSFLGVAFSRGADFSGMTFTRSADFSRAKFTGNSDFSEVTFTQKADFSEVTFTRSADFSRAKFAEDASFSRATFTGETSFLGVAFSRGADFSGMTFTRSADFSRAKFTGNSDFSGVTFSRGVDFSGAIFEGEPIFEYILNNKTYKARFSYKVNPENYNFNVYSKSPYRIEIEEQEHNGVKFIVPKGTELFEPDEPPELDDNNDS